MTVNQRFVRWQATTIAQFGFVNNLLVVLATAALGFALTEVDTALAGRYGRRALYLSLLALLVSVACGVGCAINRLLDFRATAKIARDKMGEEEKVIAREHVAGLGKASWRLFYCQAAGFGIGAVLLIWAVAFQISK